MSPRRFALLPVGILAAALLLTGPLTGSGAVAATASASTAAAAPAAARTTALSTDKFAERLVALTNGRRAKVGCPAFRVNAALTSAARAHTQRMTETGSFSHQVAREAGLASRIQRAGYKHWRMLAENIAWGRSQTPAKVFSMWMHSAPHRANIDNCRLRDIGYGVRYARGAVWATGDFGRH